MKFLSSYSAILLVVIGWIGVGAAYGQQSNLLSKNEEKPSSGSLGPFELEGAGPSKIRFQFAGQLRTDFESREQTPGQDRDEKSLMKARRVRPIMTVTMPELKLSFRLHLSTAPGSLELMDLYFDYRALQNVRFRFGQYKVPFTRYRMQSFQRLTFVDWAVVTESFGAERQMGFAVHNGYETPSKWGYAVGAFTGVNARASHAVRLAKVYGEDAAGTSDLAGSGRPAEFHPELFVHVCRNSNGMDVQSDTDDKRQSFGVSAGFSAAWDLDPSVRNDFTVRLAPEFLMKHHGISFFTVGYAAFAEIGDHACNKLVMTGGLFQIAYRFTRRYEISARYALVDFRDALVDGARDRARLLVATAESVLDSAVVKEAAQENYDAVKSRYKNAGQILREQEYTIGFNTYLVGHSLKWQNDFGVLQHTRRDGTRYDYVARSQIQLVF